MAFLNWSFNYVWCTTSVLGKGATGTVFQGVDKNNGKPVAVKTFNQMSHMRSTEVQLREFEVLKKVNHENIVKLLAIEDDQEGRGKVIVMELCTGGSLFNILDDPENTYGLPQKEFLLVLEHLCAGMKHLRDNKLVHRDLKPGNIMKFISEDGRTIYKLTDFGAARVLEEDQPFLSLYGTEEYLHPNMYEQAVLQKKVTRSFTANVDLWSIGVTLYHVATGNLPFRPYGGRKNKETMHLITTQKASGVISGTQLVENGPIEWSQTLPPHCQLSAGLKTLITPLLAGLLEETQDKMWSFDRFFKEVTIILRKRVLHVFFINRTNSIEIYMDINCVLDDVKFSIQTQTKVRPEHQILLLGQSSLDKRVGFDTLVSKYPLTKPEHPIFMYNAENNNVHLPLQLDLPKFPSFPNSVSVENDASLSKTACSVGHEIKRRIENFTAIDSLIKIGVNEFTEMVKANLKKLHELIKHLDCLVSIIIDFADTVYWVKNETLESDKVLNIATLRSHFATISEPVSQLYNRFLKEESLCHEWQSAIRDKRCPCKTRSNERAKHLVDVLRDSFQHLLRNRATRSLTHNDEQFHALEKIKISDTGLHLKALLNEDVRPNVAQIAECLADWYKLGQTVFLQTQILQKDIDDINCRLFVVQKHLNSMKDKYKLEGDCKQVYHLDQRKDMEYKIAIKSIEHSEEEMKLLISENAKIISQCMEFIPGEIMPNLTN